MTDATPTPAAQTITVVGLGNMGTAVAGTLLRAGHDVTVWNRTAGRAAGLVDDGAHEATSIGAAVASSDFVVVSLADYDATRAVFEDDEARAGLPGRTVVQLTFGNADDATEMEAWVGRAGAHYLDGNILAYPHEMGDGAALLLSGDPDVFAACRPLLEALGTPRLVGDEVRAANVLGASTGVFYSVAYGAFLELAAYLESEGAAPRALAALLPIAFKTCAEQVDLVLDQIDKGAYETEEATLDVHTAAVSRYLEAMQASGVPHRLVRGFDEYCRQAVGEGRGHLSVGAIYESLRSSAT